MYRKESISTNTYQTLGDQIKEIVDQEDKQKAINKNADFSTPQMVNKQLMKSCEEEIKGDQPKGDQQF